MPLTYKLFENDALIFKKPEFKEVAIKKDGETFLKVNFKGFPHLGIWTKKDAPFLCIEPWQGYSDSFKTNGNLFDKEGIVVLKPSEVFTAAFSIEIL